MKEYFIGGVILVVVFVFVRGLFYEYDKFENNQMVGERKNIEEMEIKPAFNTGVWLWESAKSLSSEDIQEFIEFAERSNINKVYLRIDDYIDIYETKDKELRVTLLNEFNVANKRFIEVVGKNGIKVEALGGSETWADPDYRYMVFLLLDYVEEFNLNNVNGDGFSGIQFDIESYNLSDYKKNKGKVLGQYLDTVDKIVKVCYDKGIFKDNNFRVGFAIPYWFDNENDNGVVLKWRDRGRKPVGFHLLDILNKLEKDNSYVVLMSYRNFADGPDGSIKHSRQEIEYAGKNTPNVSVLIGQETVKTVDADKISFYGMSRKVLINEMSKIDKAFRGKAVFGGLVVHDWQGYRFIK